MTRPVHVIASFNMEGNIYPLWFRLSLDPEAPAYRVRVLGERRGPYYSTLITYRCEILDGNRHMEVGLNYNVRNHFWSLTVNNSSFGGKVLR